MKETWPVVLEEGKLESRFESMWTADFGIFCTSEFETKIGKERFLTWIVPRRCKIVDW